MCQAGGGGVHGAGEGGAGLRAAGHGAAAAARPPAAGRGRRLPRPVQLQQRAVSSGHSEHSYTSTPSIIAFELFSFHGNTFKIISSFLLQNFKHLVQKKEKCSPDTRYSRVVHSRPQ